jgi:hypothetical protein
VLGRNLLPRPMPPIGVPSRNAGCGCDIVGPSPRPARRYREKRSASHQAASIGSERRQALPCRAGYQVDHHGVRTPITLG